MPSRTIAQNPAVLSAAKNLKSTNSQKFFNLALQNGNAQHLKNTKFRISDANFFFLAADYLHISTCMVIYIHKIPYIRMNPWGYGDDSNS